INENNNTKNAAPPADPPPPPPLDKGDSMDSQPDFVFNLELSRFHHDHYDAQFSSSPPSSHPQVVIVVDEAVSDIFEDEVWLLITLYSLVDCTLRDETYRPRVF
ncbi:jg25714, partial [Pararge aegeria aegeria]